MNDEMPWRRGRGARRNVPNRFEPMYVDLDPGELDEDERRSVDTTFFTDPSTSILSKNDSPDVPFEFSLNPYKGCEHGCPYCYARPSHEYWGLSAGIDFESKIFVKTQAPTLLAETLQKPSWTPQPVALSGNTDPYQPVERELEITRRCLEVFLRHRNPVSIVTKSALIRRDVDLLAEMAEYDLVTVNISLTSVDDSLAGTLEPRAARPSLRLKTIRTLSEAGIPVRILLAPLIPGLNDEEIPEILSSAAENGARAASYILLRLPGPVEDIFKDWLDEHAPDRKNRILGRLRELRDGKLNDSTFGRRFRGQGEWASVLNQLFHSARRSAGLDVRTDALKTNEFRRLPGGQMSLFDT
ncbi:radical SAM protein [Longibacter salinarum]|uniref:Radical SAM protein n=2 Tax=Longibacter salinarum TaxID=1850348 RepID=A0A2A8D049_9BACT|nr:radical SAM protein [Longibacter salinarum]